MHRLRGLRPKAAVQNIQDRRGELIILKIEDCGHQVGTPSNLGSAYALSSNRCSTICSHAGLTALVSEFKTEIPYLHQDQGITLRPSSR